MTESRCGADEVVAWIRSYSQEHGYSPTTREITAGLGISSTRVTHGILVDLKAEGRLEWDEGRARTLRVIDDHELPDHARNQRRERPGSA